MLYILYIPENLYVHMCICNTTKISSFCLPFYCFNNVFSVRILFTNQLNKKSKNSYLEVFICTNSHNYNLTPLTEKISV